MILDDLKAFLSDMEGPPSFPEYRILLSANVIRFPDDAAVPQNPNVGYGEGWEKRFRLPEATIGVEDSKSLIVLADTKADATGIGGERRFLFIQPLPRPMFPVDFYLAWGTCWLSFTIAPLRMNAGIAKEDEWFVGERDSEFSDGVQMALTMQKCDSMIGPGVTTAFEQLAYLANKERTNRCMCGLEMS